VGAQILEAPTEASDQLLVIEREAGSDTTTMMADVALKHLSATALANGPAISGEPVLRLRVVFIRVAPPVTATFTVDARLGEFKTRPRAGPTVLSVRVDSSANFPLEAIWGCAGGAAPAFRYGVLSRIPIFTVLQLAQHPRAVLSVGSQRFGVTPEGYRVLRALAAHLPKTYSAAEASAPYNGYSLEDLQPPVLLSGPPEPDAVPGVRGRVLAVITVDTAGRVPPDGVLIYASTDSLLGASVRRAVTGYRFTPAVSCGKKVVGKVIAPFVFQ
jgi:hypothetical protein